MKFLVDLAVLYVLNTNVQRCRIFNGRCNFPQIKKETERQIYDPRLWIMFHDYKFPCSPVINHVRSVGRKWFRNHVETNQLDRWGNSGITSLNGRIRRIVACVERMFTQGVSEDNREKNPSSMMTVLCVSAGSRPRFDDTKYQGRNIKATELFL